MNVLFVAAECQPFVKIGGLADVVGSLPQELKRLGNLDVRVIMPKYKQIPILYREKMTLVQEFSIVLGDKQAVYVGLLTFKKGNIQYYFIDNEFSFARETVYNFGDESERFAYFQKAVIESLPYLDFVPDVIHVHDWHAAMIPLLLKTKYSQYRDIRTVLTIHNLAYQGIFPINDYRLFNMDFDYRFEYEGYLNFLKAGIVCADTITTVSPTYAKEILTDYFGYGMQKLLTLRQAELTGIINGIDYAEFDPSKDKLLKANYSFANYREGKQVNKKALFQKLAVNFDPKPLLIGMVTRLVSQKGLDLVKRVFQEIMSTDDVRLIVIGDGEPQYVDYFRELSNAFPEKVKAYFGYSNELAHLLYGAADLFLMPSKFEPCGLGQIIALKYGTLPLVRETGGLVDTISPFNEYEQTGNGFSFTHFNAHDMMFVIRYANRIFKEKPASWDQLVEHAMSADFSWEASAKQYKTLYKQVIRKRGK